MLPESWVDRIFEKLTLTYGHRFLGLYSGISLEAVKINWAHELAGYRAAPDAIAHALDNLPADNPPTVLQFRAMCRNRPIAAPKALPAPAPDMARVSQALAGLQPRRGADPLAWAHALREREQRSGAAGLTAAQRAAWRAALKHREETTA